MSEKAFLKSSRACAVGSDRSALATVATLVAAVALFCGTERGALASAGCSAVNAGGFNVPGNSAGAKTVSGFAAGDQLTFTIAANNSGSWILSTAGFNNLAGSPLFATSGSQTKSYTVTGGSQDTTLTEYSGGLTITATCATVATAPTVTSISPPSGPGTGGGSVAVAGSGLTGVTSVNFGGNAASYTFNNDSSITATPPAGSGTVAVTVTTPGGTSTASPAVRFTYTTASGVTPVTLGPAPGTAAPGMAPVTFGAAAGTAAPGMPPVTFGPAAGTAAPGIAPVTFGAAGGTVAPGAAPAPLAPAVAPVTAVPNILSVTAAAPYPIILPRPDPRRRRLRPRPALEPTAPPPTEISPTLQR